MTSQSHVNLEDKPAPPERAAFLAELPDLPELRPLVAAFTAGNYARLRQLATDLEESCQDPELLSLADELVARTEPDPTAKKLLWLAIGFFLFILSWVYFGHAH